MFKRNTVILTLNGARATGKTILGEKILPPLVGPHNYRKGNDGFLKKEFNTILRNTRLIYLDEFPLRGAALTKIKNYMNDTVSIEGKNKDEVMETNFCSIIYSSNNITDLEIKWDERRFSVIDVRDNGLLNAMTGEEITQLVALTENEAEVYKLAHWISQNGVHEEFSDVNYHHKGDHFHRIVRANLTNWQRSFLDGVMNDCHEKMEFSMKDIKKMFKGVRNKYVPDNMSKLSDFLNNFKDREGNRPGIIRPSLMNELEAVFEPNMKFFNIWVEDTKADYEYMAREAKRVQVNAEEEAELEEVLKEEVEDEDIF